MKLEEAIQLIQNGAQKSRTEDPFLLIEKELSAGLKRFWDAAGNILHDSGVHLYPPPADYGDLSRNFFSILFLYSFHRAALPPPRRILYAAVNQCLRGMVTGCDNILDNEYKQTLATDLPGKGTRVRSVLDIMVADRVLFDLLITCRKENEISEAQVSAACSASLRALTRSAVQEASEEGGIGRQLQPEEVLSRVHHYKTGLLFQCVWAVPEIIESLPPEQVAPLKSALYDIGMGCQVLDDMVDLPADLRSGRHNYVAALMYQGKGDEARQQLQKLIEEDTGAAESANPILDFPVAARSASQTATGFLFRGLSALFLPQHQALVAPAISFIAHQIGAEGFLRTDWE